MKTLKDKLMLLLLCCALIGSRENIAFTVIAFLSAAAVSSVCQICGSRTVSITIQTVFACLCFIRVEFLYFLPLVLYDTIRDKGYIPAAVSLFAVASSAFGSQKLPVMLIAAIMLIGIIGLFFFKHNKYYYWISFISGIIFISLLASVVVGKKLKDYQLSRLIIFLNPNVDPERSGWNIIQSKIAIGAGGFWGRGYLKGTQSHLSYLPEQGTDFIFSILCEEWGFIGGFIVFSLYLIMFLRMIYIIRTTPIKYGAYITTGILGMFFFHFVENIGMVMGLMPITGIPLLFMSYGGSSLWSSMISIGFVMAVRYRRFNFMD